MASHESDGEDLKKAIAMSLAANNEAETAANERTQAVSSAAPVGILGLDRKAMEQERLARIRKRERSISPPPVRSTNKAPKLEKTPVELPSGARLTSFANAIQQDQARRKAPIANGATERMTASTAASTLSQVPKDTNPSSQATSPEYPYGVIKKTWAFGHERTGEDIKLEEVLEPLSVRTAVLSAFQWDVEWVLSKLKTPLNGGSTKCVFVMQAKEKADQDKWREQANHMSEFLHLTFPNMSGQINCMHSKLMLLFHPNKLRVAIPSANLLNFDWGETGQMENSVFLIDLPRLSERTSIDNLTPFGQELVFFIEKQGLDQDVRDGLLNFDFAATKGMAFVHTAGGYHFRDVAARTGLNGLGKAVRQLRLETDELELDFAASSIGQLNEKYLTDLHSAAKGVDFLAQTRETRSKAGVDFFKKRGTNQTAATGPQSAIVRDMIRIYFPTQDTVKASAAGSAGTICLQRKYFEAKTFPRYCFRDYKSTRTGLLSHNKILCARGTRNGSPVAWVYVGSANMSKSAWGELPSERTENKINCRNWECGVLLPVPAENVRGPNKDSTATRRTRDEHGDSETESEAEDDNDNNPPYTSDKKVPGMAIFQGLVDLPFVVPGDAYNGREPWYFTEP